MIMASSPGSFATANESFTIASSPHVQATSSLRPEAPHRRSHTKPAILPSRSHFYRPTKELPFELLNHAYVYFSEEGYTEAIALLCRLLEAGYGASKSTSPSPAYIPPRQQLALIATLAVHPKFSTHAKSADAAAVSKEALRYLRSLNKIVGPVNANLVEIFSFAEGNSTRRADRSQDQDGSDDDSDDNRLSRRIANSGSLWMQANNFWHIVGWAFNCSVKCAFRWTRWKPFLRLMLDILEDDWAIRKQKVDKLSLNEQDQLDALEDSLQQSLMWNYMASENPGSSTGRRKILRAIFADGSQEAVQTFGEIFVGESKEYVEKEPASMKQTKDINIDENDFGDYESEEDDEEDSTKDSISRRSIRPKKKIETYMTFGEHEQEDGEESALDDSEILGGHEAILLRQRFLHLLSEVSLSLPRRFTDQTDLFDNYTEFYRPLPSSLFQELLSTSHLSDESQNNLNSLLIFDIVARQRPPSIINPCAPSLPHLETHYFPIFSKKHTTSDHAKISMLLENFVCNLVKEMKTDHQFREEVKSAVQSGSLRKAIQTGINERRKKAIGDARKKGKGMEGEEDTARNLFEESSSRLDMHLHMLENSNCFGWLQAAPNTPSRMRYVLIESPASQKTEKRKKLFETRSTPTRPTLVLGLEPSSSLTSLGETPPISSNSGAGDDDSELPDL